jgi:hypothetical protein
LTIARRIAPIRLVAQQSGASARGGLDAAMRVLPAFAWPAPRQASEPLPRVVEYCQGIALIIKHKTR